MRTVVGLFENTSEAQQTIEELVRLGVSSETISIVTNLRSQRDLEAGMAMRMSLSALDTGDVGRIAAVGPLREAMRGQAGNGAHLAMMLRRSGLSNELADRYAAGVLQGDTLESITVADNDAERVAAIMRKHSHIPLSHELTAERSEGLAAEPAPIAGKPGIAAGTKKLTGRTGDGHIGVEETQTIPVAREELQVGKREIQTGAVRVSVHVVERPASGDVRLRDEVVEIERRKVDRPLRDDERLFRDETIEIREYGEEPLVTKRARVVEEVVLHKTIREHVERVHENIRDTELEVKRPFDPAFYRGHFDRMGITGGTFEEYAPAYRLGEELRSSEQLRASRWEDIEPRVRADWEAKHPGTWDKFRNAIHHSWSRPR